MERRLARPYVLSVAALLWISVYQPPSAAARHVPFVHFATVRVGEVPPRSEEYQHQRDDSAVRTHWGRRSHSHYLHLLAVLMSVLLRPGLDSVYYVSTAFNVLCSRILALHSPLPHALR